MASSAPLTTYASLISTFTDFLTVAIHTILYERAIYPQTSFLSARKYNYPVRQSRHPKVCQWINDAVSAVEAELLTCSVDRVAIVIYAPESLGNKPLERFMFDVSRFPVVPAGEATTPFERTPGNVVVDLEEQFRATMSKLSVCGTSLKPLPANCTFTVAIELKDDEPDKGRLNAPIGHPQPWVPVQPNLQRSREARKNGADLGGVKTRPVRAVEAGECVFEMWIEEGKAKQNIAASAEPSSGEAV
ncbi:DNA-binding protein [Cryomyces antarcticus]|nr:hypothetical protein LTR04_001273 [Oleoguttula sp. CCFEE 6159]